MANKPFRVGLTGGIGSGKTSVSRVFQILHVPVFQADQEARILMESDRQLINGLIQITGRDIYKGGNLDRKELASLIFNNDSMLRKVNSLVHPAVFRAFLKWTDQQSAPYVIMEAAILFESGGEEFVDRVITITAPVGERISRVMKRNNLSHDEVMQRIKAQMDDEQRIRMSDYIIENSENDMIIPAILRIHEEILKIIKT
ncbi:MAG TPA: dephospho-CoA kinase [Bacteroidales bacterium]|nr:dephospho-CoA kinase [Bacteroidales bacterium]